MSTPRKFSKLCDRETGKREYSDAELRRLDSPENLHMVCKPCNQLKNDFDDAQFKRLLAWLEANTDIKPLLIKRLNWARTSWRSWGRR